MAIASLKFAVAAAAVALGGAAAVLVLALASAGRDDPAPSVLDSVDPVLLRDTNAIELSRTTDRERRTVTVTEQQAVDVAKAADPDYAIRETALAVVSSGYAANMRCLCWVVSMYPPNGELEDIPSAGITFAKRVDVYYLTFVDARSGALLFSAQGGREVGPATVVPGRWGTPGVATPER